MNKLFGTILIIIFVVSVSPIVSAQDNTTVQSTTVSLDVKVAPGELLPISMKLSNFGGGKRVDVSIEYLITSEKGVEIYKTSETVAVETTNNFVKNIQIPYVTSPGIYSAKTSIFYQGQVTPATTEFKFTVDRKIFGLFQNQFFLYGGVTLLLSLLMVLIGYKLFNSRSAGRFDLVDYPKVPHNERVFYELISDTVLGMRQKVGDKAIDIASKIEGLSIDGATGRIIKIRRSPSKIVAELVAGYEKVLGERVSFSFREPKKEGKEEV